MNGRLIVPHRAASVLPAKDGRQMSIDMHRRRMDRVWDDYISQMLETNLDHCQNSSERFSPSADVVESDLEYCFIVKMPGIKKREITIEITNQTLVIEGGKRNRSGARRSREIKMECRYGSFQRSFVLPIDTDTAKIKTSFELGVLTVRLAKRPARAAAARQVEVGTGAFSARCVSGDHFRQGSTAINRKAST